jgi:hypothetical protein
MLEKTTADCIIALLGKYHPVEPHQSQGSGMWFILFAIIAVVITTWLFRRKNAL